MILGLSWDILGTGTLSVHWLISRIILTGLSEIG